MARATGVLVVGVLAANVAFGRPLIQSLMLSVALAVGLTPELLPMIPTVTMPRGADGAQEGERQAPVGDRRSGRHDGPVHGQDAHGDASRARTWRRPLLWRRRRETSTDWRRFAVPAKGGSRSQRRRAIRTKAINPMSSGVWRKPAAPNELPESEFWASAAGQRDRRRLLLVGRRSAARPAVRQSARSIAQPLLPSAFAPRSSPPARDRR